MGAALLSWQAGRPLTAAEGSGPVSQSTVVPDGGEWLDRSEWSGESDEATRGPADDFESAPAWHAERRASDYETGRWDDQPWRESIVRGCMDQSRDALPFEPVMKDRLRPARALKAPAFSLEGRIQDLLCAQLVRPSGATGEYVLARVADDEGALTVVVIGRTSLLDRPGFRAGEPIQALGHRGTVRQQPVFVATRLRLGDQVLDANPAARFESATHTGQVPSDTVRGVVNAIREVTDDESGARHTFLTVRQLDQPVGESVTVDLGPSADPSRIELVTGTAVTVRGHPATFAGHDVLTADLLRIDQRTTGGSDATGRRR